MSDFRQLVQKRKCADNRRVDKGYREEPEETCNPGRRRKSKKAALTGKNARAKATTKKDMSYIPVVKGVTGSEEGKQGNVALGNSVGTTDGTMGKRYLYSQKVEFQGKGSFSFSVKCTEAKTAGRNVVYGVFKQASLEDPLDKVKR